MRKGDILQLEVSGLDPSGDGVAEHDGFTVHVEAAFPGERVMARVDYVSKRAPMSHSHLVEVVDGHVGRVDAPCAQHPSRGGRCSGCALMPLSIDAQRAILRQHLRETLQLNVSDATGASRIKGTEPLGYRQSSKRVAFGRPGHVRLGSFIRGTHRIAYMDGCSVEHAAIRRAAAAVELAVQEAEVGAYDERTGEGLLRYVWFKTDGRLVVVTLILATEDLAAAEAIASRLDAHDVAGVALSVQSGTGNALRGTPARRISGKTDLRVRIAGVDVNVGPLGFLQPNPSVAGECYQALVRDASGGLAMDLYAGAGITTELLRKTFTRVIPVESYPESAAKLGVEATTVEGFLKSYQGDAPELVVANPPRKGLRREVVQGLRALGAPEIRIMSCGPKGLRRDLDQLCAVDAAGARYALVDLQGFDTLPQTPHVELVATLKRVGGGDA